MRRSVPSRFGRFAGMNEVKSPSLEAADPAFRFELNPLHPRIRSRIMRWSPAPARGSASPEAHETCLQLAFSLTRQGACERGPACENLESMQN